MVRDSYELRDILTEISGTHWVAVKFYSGKPQGTKISAPVTFCAAAARGITEPSLLKVSSIPCRGARYAFNVSGAKAPLMREFSPSRLKRLVNPLSRVLCPQRLKFSPAYVGFNLPGSADLYLSFMLNESANELAQAWTQVTGKKLNCSLSGAMSFCSEGAATALNSGKPSLSLGCDRSIKAAELQGQVCVCLCEADAARLARSWRSAPAGAAC